MCFEGFCFEVRTFLSLLFGHVERDKTGPDECASVVGKEESTKQDVEDEVEGEQDEERVRRKE